MSTASSPSPHVWPTPAPLIPTWAKVLGIISIVLGILAALGGLANAAMTAFFLSDAMLEAFGEVSAQSSGEAMFEPLLAHRGALIAQGIVETVVAIILVVGGSMLARGRAAAAAILLAWAVAKVALVVWKGVLSGQVNEEVFGAMMSSHGSAPMPESMMSIMSVVVVVFTIGWGSLLPIFMVIWFMRPKIRAEMAAWSLPDAGR